jgi:hypothetical protein
MAVGLVLATAVLIGLAALLRRRYACGLSEIPGPFWATFSIAWQVWHVIKGDIEWKSIDLHEEHGAIITTICASTTFIATKTKSFQLTMLCRYE